MNPRRSRARLFSVLLIFVISSNNDITTAAVVAAVFAARVAGVACVIIRERYLFTL